MGVFQGIFYYRALLEIISVKCHVPEISINAVIIQSIEMCHIISPWQLLGHSNRYQNAILTQISNGYNNRKEMTNFLVCSTRY